MSNAAEKKVGKFYGFDTPAELKAHVQKMHSKTLGSATVALVRDKTGDQQFSLYILARGKASEKLFLILPDSKDLAVARVRQARRDIPFIFEVLA